MLAWLGDSAEALSWWIAIGAFICCALWESLVPEHQQSGLPAARWTNHFLLYGVSLGVVALLAPFAWAVSLLGGTGHEPLTLLGNHAGDGAVLVAGVLAIDISIYGMHRLQHAVFVLWRFHAVHHADTAVDASTTLRHHPLEYLMNATIANLLFAPLGLPLWVLSCYSVMSLNVGLLQHANVRLPVRVETMLDVVFVGPALHRAHHSSDTMLYNTNFGIVFSIWDRLFGTYRRLTSVELDRLAFGVDELSTSGRTGESWSWLLPFLLRRPQRPARRLPETGLP